jgi:hypothetical protein
MSKNKVNWEIMIIFILFALATIATIITANYNIAKDRYYLEEVQLRAFSPSSSGSLLDLKEATTNYYDLNEAFSSKKAKLDNVYIYYLQFGVLYFIIALMISLMSIGITGNSYDY